MNNSHSRKDRTIFVSMIHKSITDDDLYELLSRAGPIEKIIFKENYDGTPMHALVVFRNVESVIFSMTHILPMVRSSKLIEIRPLRESSLHNSTSSSSSQLSPGSLRVEDEFQREVFHPSYLTNNSNIAPCCNNRNFRNYVLDKKPTYLMDAGRIKTSPHTQMTRHYATPSLPQSITVPVVSNSYARYPAVGGSMYTCTPQSPIYYSRSTHVGNCTNICSAET